jgi:hypothetical protein
MKRRRLWIALAMVLVLMLVALGFIGLRLTPYVHDRAVKALSERLESQVDLASLRVTWSPYLGVVGDGLTIRHRGRTDVPPLIEIKSFSADATLLGLIAKPMRLRTVHVSGMKINIPPRQGDQDRPDKQADVQNQADAKADGKGGSNSASKDAGKGGGKNENAGDGGKGSDLTIDHLLAEDAELSIIPKEADKPPRVFLIHRVELENVGKSSQATFQATLTNPKPRGEIETTGTFGPWGRDEPATTPISGTYTFSHADFSTIHGIAGFLDSTGKYAGPLERIDAEGETRTPDFTIAKAGNPVPLTTKYHAIIDGTKGDVILKRVEATLQKSSMVAQGMVIGVKGADGHLIRVNVVMDNGRIQDLLRLAVKSDKPIMIGAIDLKTDLEIPPGEADVIDKLYLNGHFGLNRARFTNGGIQQKVEQLSQRARGDTDGEPDSVASNLRGAFTLKKGLLRFSTLDFDVPGAEVHLVGSYHLRSEAFDMQGTLTLQAKISQTMTGYKSVILKMFDPLFKHGDKGAVLPITVTGTRKDPKLGMDIKKALLRRTT